MDPMGALNSPRRRNGHLQQRQHQWQHPQHQRRAAFHLAGNQPKIPPVTWRSFKRFRLGFSDDTFKERKVYDGQLGWWQLKYFSCSSRNLGKISNLTNIFSNGLVQPPTRQFSRWTNPPSHGKVDGFFDDWKSDFDLGVFWAKPINV